MPNVSRYVEKSPPPFAPLGYAYYYLEVLLPKWFVFQKKYFEVGHQCWPIVAINMRVFLLVNVMILAVPFPPTLTRAGSFLRIFCGYRGAIFAAIVLFALAVTSFFGGEHMFILPLQMQLQLPSN